MNEYTYKDKAIAFNGNEKATALGKESQLNTELVALLTNKT